MKYTLSRLGIWSLLLTKRLLKNPIFWVSLLLIPLLCFGVTLLTQEEGDMLRVAVYCEDDDALAEAFAEELVLCDSVAAFSLYESGEGALDALRTGKVDAAWGFSARFEETLAQYAADRRFGKPLVKIHQREETIFLQLARERLYSVLIPTLSERIYTAYLEGELHYDVVANAETVKRYFLDHYPEGRLVSFEFADGSTIEDIAYLRMPLRGMAAVFMLVVGLGASLVFLRENERGVYALLSQRKRFGALVITCFSALFFAACVLLVSLGVSGLITDLARELLYLVFYLFICLGFCLTFALLCRKASVGGLLLPLVVILSLLLCPVFLQPASGDFVGRLLPTYHYLNGVVGREAMHVLLLYLVCILILPLVINELALLPLNRLVGRGRKRKDTL